MPRVIISEVRRLNNTYAVLGHVDGRGYQMSVEFPAGTDVTRRTLAEALVAEDLKTRPVTVPSLLGTVDL